MNTVIYTKRKNYVRYDENHFLLYLEETIIPEYVQESHGEKPLPPVTGYAYSGDFSDGGTMIEAREATYDAFVSGLVRKEFSADRVEAITLNKLSDNKGRCSEFDREFNELENYRELCKSQAKTVLNRNMSEIK